MFDKTVSNAPIYFIISLVVALSSFSRTAPVFMLIQVQRATICSEPTAFILLFYFLIFFSFNPANLSFNLSILYVLCHWIFTTIHIIFQNRDFCFLCCVSRSFILFSSVAILLRIPFISNNCIIANIPTQNHD